MGQDFTVLGDGWWCHACHHFEDDDVSEVDGSCDGCGCLSLVHVRAKVVA